MCKHSIDTCGGYPLQLALVVFFLVPLAHIATGTVVVVVVVVVVYMWLW